MSVLEDKIKKNKDLFDVSEPREGHFDAFSEKLKDFHGEKEITPRRSIRSYWRVAAVFISLLAISATLLWLIPGSSSGTIAAADLPEDVREVKSFYEEKTRVKLEQIDQCSEANDDSGSLQEMIRQEIAKLDENSAELEKELVENSENERVKDALIMNYKTKSDLLESVIYRLCNI